MTNETREKVKKRIVRMVSALDDDDQLKLVYYLILSALRNQERNRKAEQKGGA